MEQLREIRFANHVADARTIHSLKTIVSLLTSPHSAILPLLLSSQENTNFNTDDYAALFVQLLSNLSGWPIMVCAVMVDNRSTQSQGLDRMLDQSPTLRLKCLAHMTNLVLVNTLQNQCLAQIMDELRHARHISRPGQAIDTIRRKFPKFM
jgi:hypothetical protein